MRISDWSSDVCSQSPPCLDKKKLFSAFAWHFRHLNDIGRVTKIRVSGRARSYPRAAIFAHVSFSVTVRLKTGTPDWLRSEEHTSELQSLMRISYAVFCLKKKIKRNITTD